MDEAVVLPISEVRDHLGDRIDAAHYRGEITVVTKKGAPRAVIAPHEPAGRAEPAGDRNIRPEDLVEQAWPYDGPHDADSVTTAAAAVAELARYLANATWHAHTLPYASTTYRILGCLNSATWRAVQVIEQLRDATARQAPNLYDDRRDRPGPQTATELVEQLGVVHQLAGQLAEALSKAHGIASHLGNEGRT